jgi:two-component system sensor histidine kinase/response regulator
LFQRPLIIILTVLTGLLTTPAARSQGPADLFEKLRSARADSDRVMIYYSISHLYWDKNADSALLMGQKALDIATKARFTKGMALSYLTMGVAYGTKALYPEALDCHLKALRLSEQLGLEGLTGNNYSNIGIVYSAMKDYANALDYFHRALAIARHFPAKEGIAYGFINLGETFAQDNQLDSAIAYSKAALAIGEEIHDTTALSASLNDLGDYYTRNGHPREALTYLQRALRIVTNAHDDNGVASVHISMAGAFSALHQYSPSIQLATTALQEARKAHTSEYIKAAYHLLYAGDSALKDFEKALNYRNREIALNDSLYTLEKEKQIRGMQGTYELEKKQHQIDLINKDRLLQEEELAKTRTRYYLLTTGIVLLGLWAFFLAWINTRRKHLNRLLESRNKEIENQNKQLEDLNAVKNKLLSIIGHDLRSPIGTLQGFVDLLRQSALSPEQIHHFSEKMGESLESTSRLLDNLLFWAKSQMEGIQVNAHPFDILPIIAQNRRLVQDRAAEKKITLSIGGEKVASPDGKEPATPILVYADEVMVDMVIRNLVENALKFSRAGDTVTITATAGKDNVALTVRDTGQGIPMENQDKIFRSITYTTTGTSREKGSGLGLSLCRELVEKNGGEIRFVSEPGKGTAFTFTLPAPAVPV